MPNFEEHFKKAQSNIEFLKTFAFQRANDWAVTVMFYTVLHATEAIIFKKANYLIHQENENDFDIHCKNHDDRERAVKALMNEIHYHYTQLSKAAHDGRYKVYNIKDKAVIVNHDAYFVPIIDFFNEFAKSNKIDLTLSHLK
jgi:hypothetical protein